MSIIAVLKNGQEIVGKESLTLKIPCCMHKNILLHVYFGKIDFYYMDIRPWASIHVLTSTHRNDWMEDKRDDVAFYSFLSSPINSIQSTIYFPFKNVKHPYILRYLTFYWINYLKWYY